MLLDVVREAFANALETEVGADDDFFGAGGDSLAAMVALGEIQERLGVELNPAAVFAYPTAASLAAAIADGSASVDVAEPAPEPAAAAARRVPATPIQEAHLLLAPHTAGRGYLAWVLQLNGTLDAAALATAVDDVVRRYDVLRVRFERRDDALEQVVEPFAPGVLRIVDLTDLPKLAGIETALARVEEDFRALSSEREPGLRATLHLVAKRSAVLAVFVAEALVDSESGPLVAAELSRAYAAAAGLPPPEDLPVASEASYVDHVAARPLAEAAARRAEAYWATVPPRPLPPWPAVPDREDGTPAFSLTSEEWGAVLGLARALRTTPYAVVLAAYQVVLARLLGVPRVTVDSVVSDRGTPATERMVGSFHSVVRLEGGADPGETFADAVARATAAVRDAVAHCAVPAPVADLRAGRAAAGEPALGPSFFMFDSRIAPTFTGVRRRRFRPRAAGREPIRLNCVAAPEDRQDLALSGCAPAAVLAEVAQRLRALLLAGAADPGLPAPAVGVEPEHDRAFVLR